MTCKSIIFIYMVKIVLTAINGVLKKSKLLKDMIFNDNNSLYINLRLTKKE